MILFPLKDPLLRLILEITHKYLEACIINRVVKYLMLFNMNLSLQITRRAEQKFRKK